MKKFLLVSLFTLSLASFSQTDDKQPLNPDSLVQKTDELKDSISNRISTIKPTDNYIDIDRNMQYIQEIQKKNNDKQTRDSIMAQWVVDFEAPDQKAIFDELHRGGVNLEAAILGKSHQEPAHGAAQRDPAQATRLFVAAQG